MRVRQPNFDFDGVEAHWTKNAEFAQGFNATGIVPAYIEPYLIKVMRRVLPEIGEDEKQLRAEIDIFIRQEAQHYRQHQAFNKVIRDAGYDRMIDFERAYDASYDKFLNKKSLRFNVAYAEGFEAIGSFGAGFWVEHAEKVLPDIDTRPLELWRWHLAEEFEHRSVCFNIYHKLYGRGLLRGYFHRIYGFLYAVVHIGYHTTRLAHYLLEKDRESMTPDEAAASRRRESAYNRQRLRQQLPLIRAVLSPFYDPAKLPAPKGLDDVLAKY